MKRRVKGQRRDGVLRTCFFFLLFTAPVCAWDDKYLCVYSARVCVYIDSRFCVGVRRELDLLDDGGYAQHFFLCFIGTCIF